MIILGIQEAHDASACLMVDGRIVACVQEERFSRQKGDYGYPERSIAYCLKFAGIESKDIDLIGLASLNWNPVLTYFKRNANFEVEDWVREQYEFWSWQLNLSDHYKAGSIAHMLPGDPNPTYYEVFKWVAKKKAWRLDDKYPMKHLLSGYMDKTEMEQMRQVRKEIVSRLLGVPEEKIRFVLHEDCHKYYAYFGSPLAGTNALVLTAEGCGDYSNGTVTFFDPVAKKPVEWSQTKENHLGHLYQYITLLLGMKPAQHEYKVMGLAPYANERERERSYRVFRDILEVDWLLIKYKNKPKDLYFHFREALEGHRFDGIAAGLQKWVEEILTKWTANCIDSMKPLEGSVCFSGGVAQNIKACKAMAEICDWFSVLPAAGDPSLPIGACYFLNHGKGNFPLDTVYLGPDVGTNDEVARKLIDAGYGERMVQLAGPKQRAKFLAKEIADGNIIGRCAGRMEFGHRALGNRSILADPRDPAIVERLNRAIKFRDWWMPFTPTILDRGMDRYIIDPNGLDARFMCMAFDSTVTARREIPATLHPADKTIRPQNLARWENPDYYDLIDEFSGLTGVPAILNTSQNLHGDPICCSVEDALYTFENSGLDGLLVGDWYVR